jgi:hypothetical protein
MINAERERISMAAFYRHIRGDVTELINSLDSYGHMTTLLQEHHHDHFIARLEWAGHDEHEANAIASYRDEHNTFYGFSDQKHSDTALQKTYDDQPVSWFAVSDALFAHLQSNDELVVDTGALCLWGRFTFGQRIIVDHVFQSFVDKHDVKEQCL